jgi:hypothetical protein
MRKHYTIRETHRPNSGAHIAIPAILILASIVSGVAGTIAAAIISAIGGGR